MQVGLCNETNILLELPAKIEAFETPGVICEDIVAFHFKLWLWGVGSIHFPRSGGAAYTMGKVKWDVERKERKGNKSGGEREREGAGYYYCSWRRRRPLRYLAGGAGAASSYVQSLSDTVTLALLDVHNQCYVRSLMLCIRMYT